MNLSKQENPAVREHCAAILRTVLNLQETDPQRSGFFLQAAAVCYQESLRLSKICQQFDSFSESRIYDLHYAFIELAGLYANKAFPGYQPEKATSYYEDCLLSIQEIALRPESHERYIRVPIKVYDRLVAMYMDEQKFDITRSWLEKGTHMRELYVLYHPGVGSEFDRCYAAESPRIARNIAISLKCPFLFYEASRVSKARGIKEAEPLYLDAAATIRTFAEQCNTEEIWRIVATCYTSLYIGFRQENGKKAIEYIQQALKELDYAIEHLENAYDLRKIQCQLYGMLADDLKDSSDIDLVSAAADLYLLQINQYIRLHQETNDDSLVERLKNAYSKRQNFLNIQENVVKLARQNESFSVETLRKYINILIHGYSNLFESEEVRQKLDYYQNLLDELDEA